MKVFSSLRSPPIVPHFGGERRSPRRETVGTARRRRCVRIRAAMADGRGDDDRADDDGCSGGGIVDSDMPVLRRRIREAKSEGGQGAEIVLPLSNRVISVGTQYCRTIFESEACEVLGTARLDPSAAGGDGRAPRLEIGVTVMVSISMPVPVLVIMLYVMDAAKGVVDLMHQNANEEDAMH